MSRTPAPEDPCGTGGSGWEAAGVAASMIESSPLATIGIDTDDVIRVLNGAAARLLGAGPEHWIGSPVDTLFVADGGEHEVLQRIHMAVEGDLGHLELELRTTGGSVPVGMAFNPIVHEGERIGSIGVGHDITDRRALEHEAAQLAESSRALAESSVVGMYRFSFHPEMRVDHINPSFAQALGYTSDELLADASPFWTNISSQAEARFIENRRSPTPSWPLEFDWTQPDGTRLTFSVTEVPLHDPEGRLHAVLGIARDITSELRARTALTEALDMEREVASALRRVDELRRLFLQAVSHELRTPLTVVTGFAATLRDRVDQLGPEQVAVISQRICAQAEKMEALLDDLLDVERVSRGVSTIELARLDVSDVARAVLVAERGSPVGFSGDTSWAWVDRVKVERIVSNLVSNAYRHAGESAVVHLDVRVAGDRVRISVEDDGPGVSEELRERIFEAFEQGPTASGAASPGTGIGLALVAAFTRLHGGSVHVEDAVLGGARFVVELPSDRLAECPGADDQRC